MPKRKKPPPDTGTKPAIRLWRLDHELEMFALQFVTTGDLYVVNHDTAVETVKRSSGQWTINQDG